MSEILDLVAPGGATPERAYRLDASAGHLLRRAHQRYQAVFTECAVGLGLTGPQFAALLRLSGQTQVVAHREACSGISRILTLLTSVVPSH